MTAYGSTCLLGCALWLATIAPNVFAQTADEWRAQQATAAAKADKLMTGASAHTGLLAQYQVMREAYASDNSRAFRLIFGQYLSWYQSFVGDYRAAMVSFSIAQARQPDDHPSPLAGGDYVARSALDAIPELAKDARVVLFNEAHNVVLTRSLIVPLLSRLRQQGFDYFAAETLVQSDTGLQARGYPTGNSGFYTEEPVYAEMVRSAMQLGFKIIAYEATSDSTNADAREAEQARNIYRQVFEHDPHARLIINAGYEHIVKSDVYLNGASMAEHLAKLTGAPMLVVEQTVMYPHPLEQDDHPYYTDVMHALQPDTPIVFVNAAGKAWTLRGGYDASVFFPPEHFDRGRPTWLSLNGLRQARLISAEFCHARYPCLVEARYRQEGADAIPADRLLLELPPASISSGGVALYDSDQDLPAGYLYLRPGDYQLSFIVDGDKLVHRQSIHVPAAQSTGQPSR